MGIEAVASIKICLASDVFVDRLKKICKDHLNDCFYRVLYKNMSFHKDHIEGNEFFIIDIEGLDDRNFWVARFGLTMLKHGLLGKMISADDAEKENHDGKDADILMDFCKATNSMIEFYEGSDEIAIRERTIAIADEILLYEEDKSDEPFGEYKNKDFGKTPASEFYEKWLLKTDLNTGIVELPTIKSQMGKGL